MLCTSDMYTRFWCILDTISEYCILALIMYRQIVCLKSGNQLVYVTVSVCLAGPYKF